MSQKYILSSYTITSALYRFQLSTYILKNMHIVQIHVVLKHCFRRLRMYPKCNMHCTFLHIAYYSFTSSCWQNPFSSNSYVHFLHMLQCIASSNKLWSFTFAKRNRTFCIWSKYILHMKQIEELQMVKWKNRAAWWRVYRLRTTDCCKIMQNVNFSTRLHCHIL